MMGDFLESWKNIGAYEGSNAIIRQIKYLRRKNAHRYENCDFRNTI